MQHLQVLTSADSSAINGKSFERRAAGRFYTHELIGTALADCAVGALDGQRDRTRILDPFCGDGRLTVWALQSLAAREIRRISVGLWDVEAGAVDDACARVLAAARRLDLEVDLEPWAGDTFDRAVIHRQRWDLVITNPPWELLKPDRRELKRLPEALRVEYIAELKSFDRRLASEYPTSQPSRRFAGWGTNLSRVGTEVAARLTARGGVCAVVCPASLLADSTTSSLRRWLFDNFMFTTITHYPAEARLFEAVDVPCCTFVAVRGGEPRMTNLVRVSPAREVEDSSTVMLDRAWLNERDYAIPVQYGGAGIDLLRELDRHAPWRTLEVRGANSLWAGRELDETGRAAFTRTTGARPFVRSCHIARLRITDLPDSEFVDTDARPVPASASQHRLVWRDISRPSQIRRVHASLLPPGPVTGNSVSVAFFKDGDLPRLLALLGLVSSLPFEFQVRSLLMTHHVSLSVMRSARLPRLTAETIPLLAQATYECLQGSSEAEARLEREAARAYGLPHDLWSAIADHFSLASEARASLDFAWAGH
jgi:Alw26I/Eco31I/Esp3I family type II restriction m6 adenine DNA methyltransferase